LVLHGSMVNKLFIHEKKKRLVFMYSVFVYEIHLNIKCEHHIFIITNQVEKRLLKTNF